MNMEQVFRKIREKGLFACMARLGLEVMYATIWILQRSISFLFLFNRKTLLAYYDFSFCPASYDSVWFFIAAEMKQMKKKCKEMRLVFYPQSFKKPHNYGIMRDGQGQMWRFENIVIPTLTLFSHIQAYTVWFSKWRSIFALTTSWHIFPYHPLSPFRYRRDFVSFFREAFDEQTKAEKPWGLRASVAAKRYIHAWMDKHLQGRKLIVISLRCSPFVPKRNSKIAEWAAFAKSCDATKFFVVFVMDTDVLLEGYPTELQGFAFFDAASWNVGIRAALYEEAYLCLGTFIGPGGLWMLNNHCRYISFKVAIEGEPSASEELMARLGFVKGQNVPWASPFQKIVWEDDDCSIIQREFLLMCEEIEKKSSSREKAGVA